MADVNKETILLEIETNFGDTIQQMATLKTRIDNLKDANRDLEKENKNLIASNKELNKDYAKNRSEIEKNEKLIQLNNNEIEKNASVIRNLSEQQREYRKEVENEVKARQENEGSIKQMRLQLIELRKEYESLSKEDRESVGGKNMLKDIERQTKAIKELEYQQLDFRRNVGNYADALLNVDPAIAKLLKGFKDLSGGTMQVGAAAKNVIPFLKALGAQLKALVMNPVGAVIITIVVAFKALKDAIQRNDDAMTSLQAAFKAFSPIAELFRDIMDTIVAVIVEVVNGISTLATSILSLIPSFKESSEAASQWVIEMDNLEEAERQYTVQSAKNAAEVAKLRGKAVESDKYSAEQRKRFLEEAIRLEEEDLQAQLKIAEKKYKLAVEEAERQRDTSDETKNNIAQLEAAYYNAIANTESGLKRLKSQISNFNKEILKESLDTQLKIVHNENKTAAERKKALNLAKKESIGYYEAEYQRLDALYKQAALDPNNDRYREIARERDEAKKNLDKAREEMADEEESLAKSLKAKWEQYYQNELSARRAYEDAVLGMMDESLDKQLKLIDTEYDREIEDLKHRLETEESLTVEARNKINQLIELKEKQRNEKRVLTEAKYWSETREMARTAMNDIAQIMATTMRSDPNNILGGFAAEIHNELAGITEEFESTSDSLLEFFGKQYEQLVVTIRKVLNNNELSKTLAPNVKAVLAAMEQGTEEFANNATKSLDSFILALETMQNRLNMSPAEIAQMKDVVKPIMDQLYRYYNTMAELPSKYMERLSNAMANKMNAEAKKMRDVMMKTFEFQPITDEQVQNFTRDIDIMDNVLKNALSAWQYRIDNEIGFKIDDPLKIKGIDWDKERKELDDKIQDAFGDDAMEETVDMKVKVNWDIVTENEDFNNKMAEMANKYGDTIDLSFSGILTQISGTDKVEEQLDWLLKNYDEAIKKVREMNDDMWAAYSVTGEKAFYDAIPDTSTVLQGLQQLYNTYIQFSKTEVDYNKERLEIENKYLENGGSEVAMQNELLEVTKRENEQKKAVAEQQKAYVMSLKGEVSELEAAYNKVNAENTQQIQTLETQLQILHDEAATIDASTPEGAEKLEANRLQAEEIRSQIELLRGEIEQSLSDLVATGFTSAGQIDEEVEKLEVKVLDAQNNILQATATQTSNWSKMWFSTFSGVTSGLGDMAGSFRSLFDEMGEGNEQMAAFAEAAAYFQIGMSLAEGLAAAVAKGIEMGWPAAAVMIPVGISLVTSTIAQAMQIHKQYHAPKYAKGGYVSGEKGVDKIPAWLSDGEYVIKRKRVKELGIPFLDALNEGKSVFGRTHFAEGGLVTTTQIANEQLNMDTMREIMVESMAEIQPVVSVKEITSTQNRVKTKENIARK